MRFATIFSLIFTCCWALLSGSPVVYAAPVPSRVGSTEVKRGCSMYGCRIIESPSTDTDSTSQLTEVQKLVQVLMDALQSFQTAETPSNATTVDLATPAEDAGEPEPVVDTLLGDTEV